MSRETRRFEVRFEPSGRSVVVEAGTSALEAARRAGLPVASSCGADGVCGRCGLRVLACAVPPAPEAERERDIKQRNRIDPVLRLSCRLQVECDLTLTAPYW
jgi:2Fe-2S ferredoxin